MTKTHSVITTNERFYGHNGNLLHGKMYGPEGEERVPGVVLCHGYNTDQRSFDDFPEKLAGRGYKVLTFDYSGHGISEGTPTVVTAESHQTDTRAALDHMRRSKVSRLYILGHSLGSHAAMGTLFEQEDVKAGILVTPMRRGAEHLGLMKRALFYLAGHIYALIGRYLPEIYVTSPVWHEHVPNRGIPPLQRTRCSLRYCAYSISINNARLAGRISKPVLCIIAGQDEIIDPSAAEEVYEGLKSRFKDKCYLGGAKHDVFFSFDTSVLAERVDVFLKKAAA